MMKIIVKAIQLSYDSGLMTDLDLNIYQINCSMNDNSFNCSIHLDQYAHYLSCMAVIHCWTSKKVASVTLFCLFCFFTWKKKKINAQAATSKSIYVSLAFEILQKLSSPSKR